MKLSKRTQKILDTIEGLCYVIGIILIGGLFIFILMLEYFKNTEPLYKDDPTLFLTLIITSFFLIIMIKLCTLESIIKKIRDK